MNFQYQLTSGLYLMLIPFFTSKAVNYYINSQFYPSFGIYVESIFKKSLFSENSNLFPGKKLMILNSIARRITGNLTINQGISLTNLFKGAFTFKIFKKSNYFYAKVFLSII